MRGEPPGGGLAAGESSHYEVLPDENVPISGPFAGFPVSRAYLSQTPGGVDGSLSMDQGDEISRWSPVSCEKGDGDQPSLLAMRADPRRDRPPPDGQGDSLTYLSTYEPQVLLFARGTQKTIMPDPGKSTIEDVQGEAADKLCFGQPADHFSTSFSIILGRKGDRMLVYGHDPVVADGDFMTVPAQVFDDLPGAAKGSPGIDHPGPGCQFLMEHGGQ